VFECEGDSLVGIVTIPESRSRLGVLILVGGPQYRVGAHRQFRYLARKLAEAGYSSMRFDYRGMGDSTGRPRRFWEVQSDVRVAVDTFLAHIPELSGVVFWGLCGGASAACLHPVEDSRIEGVVLVNPWLTSANASAKVLLRHYYLKRFFDRAFWAKLLRGEFRFLSSFTSVIRLFEQSCRTEVAKVELSDEPPESLGASILATMHAYPGKTALFLSGRDYVAQAFEESLRGSSLFDRLLQLRQIDLVRFAEDNHTFSSEAGRSRLVLATLNWMRKVNRNKGESW